VLPDLGEEPLGGDSIANEKFTAAKRGLKWAFGHFGSKLILAVALITTSTSNSYSSVLGLQCSYHSSTAGYHLDTVVSDSTSSSLCVSVMHVNWLGRHLSVSVSTATLGLHEFWSILCVNSSCATIYGDYFSPSGTLLHGWLFSCTSTGDYSMIC
jgi:hypothetical protein